MIPLNNTLGTSQIHGATSSGHNPQGLNQQNQPPTQRTTTSLEKLAQHSTAKTGPVTQDLQATPKIGVQSSVQSEIQTQDPDDLAAKAAAQQIRGARLRPGEKLGRSLMGESKAESTSSKKSEDSKSSAKSEAIPQAQNDPVAPKAEGMGWPLRSTKMEQALMGGDQAESSKSKKAEGKRIAGESGKETHIQKEAGTSSKQEITQAGSPKLSRTEQTVQNGVHASRTSNSRMSVGDGLGPNINDGREPLAKPGSNAVTLDKKGKASFENFSPPALNTLLQDTVGKKDKTYLAHQTTGKGNDQVLLEPKGHLLKMQQSDTGFTLLRSSKSLDVPSGSKPGSVALQRQGNSMSLEGLKSTVTQALPDKAHIAHLSGAHQDSSGQTLRVHDEKLYQFKSDTLKWTPLPDTGDKKFSSLSTEGDGKLYARSGDSLISLSGEKKTEMTLKDLGAHSVASDGTVAMLAGKDTQTLQLGKMGEVPELHITLDLNDGKSEASSIGLTKDRLFVADTEGKLYSAARDELKTDTGVLKLSPEKNYQPEEGKLGGRQQVTGFMSGDDGQLHALIKDGAGQVHSHTLDEKTSSLQSGWNLSDVKVLENTQGLPVKSAPTPENTYDLHRNGRVGLVDGSIQTWDSTTQAWKDSGVKDIDALKRGIDGNAYVLKDGKVHELKVTPDYGKSTFNDTHNLKDTPRSTKVELGDAIAGLEDRVIKDFAMYNDKQFVAVDDKGRMTAHHKDGDPSEMTRHGLEGTVAHLTMDANGVHAATSNGELFFMLKEDWQKKPDEAKPSTSATAETKPSTSAAAADKPSSSKTSESRTDGESKWQKIPLHFGSEIASIRTEVDNTLSITLKNDPNNNGSYQLKDKKWQTIDHRPADQNELSNMFKRLDDGMITKSIPGVGTLRITSNMLGRSGIEQGHKSSTSEFIKAHVIKLDTEVRPAKNVVNYIDHKINGRDGLADVYNAQAPLFHELKDIRQAPGKAPEAGHDLKTRISKLDIGEEGKALTESLESFREELENHSRKAVMTLGEKAGLLNLHGEPTEKGKKAASKTESAPPKRNEAKNDLIALTQGALDKVSPSSDNPTGALLKSLQGMGMKMRHLDADTPADKRRHGHDEHALTKARLALDIGTLNEVGKLLDKAEKIPDGPDKNAQIKAIKNELTQLRDKTYGENPIKQVSDMGFTEHYQIEKSYDGIKAFLNGFHKPDHATSVNMRAATGSKDQAELADKFKNALKQLEFPDDEISLSRSYGMTLSTPFIGIAKHVTGPFPSGQYNNTRNYAFAAERGDKGVEVYLLRERANLLSGTVGVGKDVLPDITTAGEYAKLTTLDLGNEKRGALAFRVGGDITLAGTHTQRTGVAFTVPDEKIDQFVDNLFTGKLTALDVLKEGANHKAHEMKRVNVDLTAGANTEFRVQLGMSDHDSKPLTASARFGAGFTANVNLANFTWQKLSQENDTSRMDEKSQNRVRLLNNVNAGAFARAQVVGGHTNPTPSSAPGSQAITSTNGITGTASLDDKTTKRIKFQFKEAAPLTTANVTKLATSLGDAFKDKASKAELTRLADHTQPEYKDASAKEKIQIHLKGLNDFFSGKTSENDDQYAALRALKRSTAQQEASVNKHSVLDNGRFESNYTNLARLDSQNLTSKIMSVIYGNHQTSNAENIAKLIDQDPALKSILKEFQSQPGTLARVRLEPKDHVFDRVDAGSRDGTLTQKEMFELLSDRDNMRILAISVFKSAAQTDGFTTPTPLISGSSSASMAVNQTLAKVNFSYGEDQDKPKAYYVNGEISRASQDQKTVAQELKKSGLELKS
ncbi:AvrE-family type 3 secretion system effector [Pseudomonas cichorii]|uniref:AvrE-family type 3 secretion system effector n=1 Tax=Pseudomonas cichorii TaxID=36746 RepID=UPI001C8A82E6|nr:AvrE-family type 3 secretion system effector [Pseudomonas cichorii]MBX8496253.1 AvrE-family type 3 secretion system effector [Pseudomonas cichorii]